MKNEKIKSLCLELLKADTEDQVKDILVREGYWDDANSWRLYGDKDQNFAQGGNQQSRSDQALVEKVVNSVDARLMNECLVRGIDPTAPSAPQTIREAVTRFFGTGKLGRDQAKLITIAATGTKKRPSLTIADQGEGQTPNKIPETLLSLDRKNKLRIHFVQGKFNMGGTGVLRFCGRDSLELVISKRNPKIKSVEVDSSKSQWGFTVVRRERPVEEAGAVRNSVYRYLAPLGADGNAGGEILRFDSDTIPGMPEGNVAYSREIGWGTVIKLFDFDMKGFASNVLMKDGLLYRLEVLLPEIALPVRVHECRDYGGKEGSYETSMAGLCTRLEEGKGDNLEAGFPDSVPFSVHGQKMVAKIYAFKKGKAETYRTNEGVILSLNGQTHGAFPKTFFERKAVKMDRLADSLLVMVDCSAIDVATREDLFMASRDRMSQGSLRKDLESEIEDIIGNHSALRELRERRKNEEIAGRLEDSKPLEAILDGLIKMSPTLSQLFLKGQRLHNPHKKEVVTGTGAGGASKFVGKKHPTQFKFVDIEYGEACKRECQRGRRCRLRFETDVENQYFSRLDYPGTYSMEVLEGELTERELNNALTLHDGFAHWSIEIPDDAEVGQELTIQCTVTDDTLSEPFVNIAKLTITPFVPTKSSSNGKPKSKANEGDGNGEEQPTGIVMPPIIPVREAEWAKFSFDKTSACKVVRDVAQENGRDVYQHSFYINLDNASLRTEMRGSKDDPKLIEAKFKYGIVLTGVAMLHDEAQREKRASGDIEGQNVRDRIADTARAIAPFLVPMINYLGALTESDVSRMAAAGDEA